MKGILTLQHSGNGTPPREENQSWVLVSVSHVLITHTPNDSCRENNLSASLEYGTRPSTPQRQWKWVSFSLFYAYLGTVSFKPPPTSRQNSAALLANNVIIRLLLKGRTISFSPAFRKNSAQTKSTVWTSPSHQTNYRLLSYKWLFSCPSHLGLNILRKPQLPVHSHFWNLKGIK